MAVKATPYEFGLRDVLGKRIGDRLTVADGGTDTVPADQTGLWRIAATSDCQVDFGPSADAASAASDGDPFPAGHIEVRYLKEGDVIACAAGL